MLRRFTVTSLAATMVLATMALPAAGQAVGSTACPGGADDPGFSDVAAGNVHIDAIACAVERGIVRGTSATAFDPGGSLTRGQTATIVAGTLDALNLPLPPLAGAPDFDDAGAVHADAIRRLAAADIVSGRGDGSFGPGGAVTRGQLASILVRTWEFVLGDDVEPPADGTFDDLAGSVHADNIEAAAELGLLLGRGDGTFGPAATTRRDQAASVLVRLLDQAPEQLVGEVWSLDQGTDRIHVYAGDDDNAELATIDVSPEALQAAGFADAPTGAATVPHMIEFDSQERYAFVASTAGQVTIVIDTRSKQVAEVLATGAGTHMAAVTPDDSAVWVAVIGAEEMVEIPLALDADDPAFTIGRRLDVGELLEPLEAANGWEFPSYSPVCHQYSTDSTEAWVTLGPGWNQGGFFVLDLESGTASAAWDPEEVRANCGVSVSDTQVLANWSGQVLEDDYTNGEWYVFDVETKELRETYDAEGFDAHGLRLSPDGSTYWTVNRASDNALLIDAETLEVVERHTDVAETPDIIDFSADGSRVYISQRGPSPRSGAIHAAAGDTPGVAIVDAATGDLVTVLEPPEVRDTEGTVLNDVHGVGFRNRGDGVPVATATLQSALPEVVPVRSSDGLTFGCHLPPV